VYCVGTSGSSRAHPASITSVQSSEHPSHNSTLLYKQQSLYLGDSGTYILINPSHLHSDTEILINPSDLRHPLPRFWCSPVRPAISISCSILNSPRQPHLALPSTPPTLPHPLHYPTPHPPATMPSAQFNTVYQKTREIKTGPSNDDLLNVRSP